MKSFLMVMAVALMAIGASSAYADHHGEMTAGEELVESTEAMSAEAEAEFNADVDCVEKAMGDEIIIDEVESAEGEVPADDCVSKAEDDSDITVDTEIDVIVEEVTE